MDPAAKKVWVGALRSGEYKQTRGKLCSLRGAMCCLGVLIDATQDGEWDLVEYDGKGERYSYKGADSLLPESIREQVGLAHQDVLVLADLNDHAKYNFRKIADYIETNL